MSSCIVFFLILCTAIIVGSEEVPNDSTYGERLADSSSYIFNSVSARDSIKEEGSVYSSGINAILNSDGFLNSMTKLGGSDAKYTPTGPVEAAVHTKKTVEVIPVRFEEPKDGEPQVIEITPYEVPLSIVFKTQTNKIQVNQEHKTGKAIYNHFDGTPVQISTSKSMSSVVFPRSSSSSNDTPLCRY